MTSQPEHSTPHCSRPAHSRPAHSRPAPLKAAAPNKAAHARKSLGRRQLRRRQQGFSLIEVMIALSILLGFLSIIVPAMYRAQYGNAQSAYLNAGTLIISSLAPQFVNQRGQAFDIYRASTMRSDVSCDQHLQGMASGSSVNLGPVANLGVFTEVTSGDARGYNDPALYSVTVQPELAGSLMVGMYQRYTVSVFYPNPTNPTGARSCYSVLLNSNSIYRQAP